MTFGNWLLMALTNLHGSASQVESGRCQQCQLRCVQITLLTLGQPQRIEFQSAYLRTSQRNATVSGGSQHAFVLMMFALIQHDFQRCGAGMRQVTAANGAGSSCSFTPASNFATSSGMTGSCVAAT